ncbi:hypothetical protein UPYG_G00185590 [Umbra pygmaea]|uniref:Transmembrane protein 132D n=1 Tax=Umbra pygmaea TaxID=75934 RepID=A0ABD0WT47_UMBPY
MSIYYHIWRILQIFLPTIVTVVMQELDSQEMSDNTWSSMPYPVFLPVSYQVVDTDFFFLKEAGQDIMRNFSMQTQTQPFLMLRASRPPSVNASYGPLSTVQPVPLEMVQTVQLFRARGVFIYNWKVHSFVLTPRVYSSTPIVRVLFYVAGRDWDRGPEGLKDELPCVTVFAFWQTQEVRGSCALGGLRGTCMAELEPVADWFSSAAESSSRERLDLPEGNTAELYYQARPSVYGKCRAAAGGRWGSSDRPQQAEYIPATPMQRIGSVRLLQVPKGKKSLSQLKLGKAIVIQTSSKPLKKTDIATFYIFMVSSFSLENFTLRAIMRKGVLFRTATPSNSLLWDITLDAGVDSTIAVVCQRKSAIPGKRMDSNLLEVLQMDFEVQELSSQLDSQVITWRLELPPDTRDVGNKEGSMRIYTIQRDFVGLAPLVMDSEILNTAVLTGIKVVMPVRTVAVEEDGSVTDVSDFTDCSSTDEDVLKVSDRCDYVFVNGKEIKGQMKMMVNFTYSYLSAQLEMNVWFPRLPLQIEVSDTQLSQIKGWRVPIASTKSWNSEEDEEEDKKGKGCMLQFQHALLRVVTHFNAEQSDPREPQAYLLGSDWQVDVTKLVRYFLKVEDPRIARLQAGNVLSGRDVGTTSIQVLSPLSDSILAEKTVMVMDDKVTITELGVQLVTGLALSLKLSPGSSRAILATATTQEVLQSPKQEAAVSSWVQFSDGAMTPLDIYDPANYRTSFTSLDEGVVSVDGSTVLAEGEGEGVLVRVEMGISEACQKSKRKSTLAVGSGSLKVKFQVNGRRLNGNSSSSGASKDSSSGASKDSSSDYGNDGEEDVDSERKQQQTLPSSSASEREESAMRKVTTTSKSTERDSASGSMSSDGKRQGEVGGFSESGSFLNTGTLKSPINNSDISSSSDYGRTEWTNDGLVGGIGSFAFSSTVKAPRNLVDYKNLPSDDEVADQEPVEMDMGSEDMLSNLPFSDLEMGMYALLGVFCVAILVFLVNCISYVVKFRHKQPPAYGQEPAGHRHDWVWLGTDAELIMNVPGSPQQQGNHSTTTVIDIGPDQTASLPRPSGCLTSTTTSTLPGCSDSVKGKPVSRTESLHSPTSKRKRVQFTTFASLDRQQSPHLPRENGHGIHWVGKDENSIEPQVPITEPVDNL